VAQIIDLVALIEKKPWRKFFNSTASSQRAKKIPRRVKFPCILVFFFYIRLTQLTHKGGVEVAIESKLSLVPCLL